jgi:8-oxo-dGTP pyrophosphatase MutT (NUDIX family)
MEEASGYLRQAAVVPVKGRRVCLVTSSNGKRWVVPKGVIDAGHTAGESGLVEAWEEAGLVGILQPTEPVGSYLYDKWGRVCHVTVFRMEVTEVFDQWPEDQVRQRDWVGLKDALERIEEQGLREIVRAVLEGGGRKA